MDAMMRFAGKIVPYVSYSEFKQEVLFRQRYIRSENGLRFLAQIGESVKDRIQTIASGETFWRAQNGYDWRTNPGEGSRERAPLQIERMKPWLDRALEGRVNSKGISCLYLATSQYVAMSEIRPWIGTTLSLARFRTVRSLKLVDCSRFHAGALNAGEFDSANTDEKFWRDIDRAFAQPVSRSDNTADYTPTQVIAEYLRLEGFEGIIYGSAFCEHGRNIALFDINAAEQTDASLYEVTGAKFDFSGI